MIRALLTSDLHGNKFKYNYLFEKIREIEPEVVFIGGDILLPFNSIRDAVSEKSDSFLCGFLKVELQKLKEEMGECYPEIFVIMGNDDNRISEEILLGDKFTGLLTYCHKKKIQFKNWIIVGYNFVPPTPFMNKDWEKYDVSRFVDVGCVAPEQGYHDSSITEYELKYTTIKEDFEELFDSCATERTILLSHTPPYQTKLDRADLDGKMIDYAPLDVNIGSIALKRLLENRKFYLTMHGHVHESTRITGEYTDTIGDNLAFQGASERDEACVISFDLDNPYDSIRITKTKL